MRRLRGHLTYANVTATLALAVALGMGSAYAAGQLGPKSVGERELRPGAVTAHKIRKNAVTAPKIKAEAVKQGKVANGAIVADKIAAGAVGETKIAAGAVTPGKIPDDSIDGSKVNEASLGQVPSARSADFADFAASANPEAFAEVNAEGTVFPANSKGIGTADVRKGKLDGIYCIDVGGFNPRGAQVTPEYSGNNNVSIYVKFGGTESCTASEIEVRNYNAGSLQKGPFHILIYR